MLKIVHANQDAAAGTTLQDQDIWSRVEAHDPVASRHWQLTFQLRQIEMYQANMAYQLPDSNWLPVDLTAFENTVALRNGTALITAGHHANPLLSETMHLEAFYEYAPHDDNFDMSHMST